MIFSGFTGQTFAEPSHFDLTCSSTLSVQYQGAKIWWFSHLYHHALEARASTEQAPADT